MTFQTDCTTPIDVFYILIMSGVQHSNIYYATENPIDNTTHRPTYVANIFVFVFVNNRATNRDLLIVMKYEGKLRLNVWSKCAGRCKSQMLKTSEFFLSPF